MKSTRELVQLLPYYWHLSDPLRSTGGYQEGSTGVKGWYGIWWKSHGCSCHLHLEWITWCSHTFILFCGEDEGNDEAIEPQDLSEDQDEDHAHEEPGLLGCASHACISHNADGKASCQPTQTHTQSSTQVEETPIGERGVGRWGY